MRAVDTNVVVRYLTNDDRAQAARAQLAVDDGDVFISVSVLLETEWVLRSGGYGFKPERIVQALRHFARLPSVTLENRQAVERALEWAEAGLDFADALHLASANDCREMLSFDRKFAKAAARVSDLRVIAP